MIQYLLHVYNTDDPLLEKEVQIMFLLIKSETILF